MKAAPGMHAEPATDVFSTTAAGQLSGSSTTAAPSGNVQDAEESVAAGPSKEFVPTTLVSPQHADAHYLEPVHPPSVPLQLQNNVYLAAGYYKDRHTTIEAVPEWCVETLEEATKRLIALKGKVNELQARRKRFWKKNAGGVVFVALTGPVGLAVRGGLAMQHSRLIDRAKNAIRECLGQIVELRGRFGDGTGWKEAEEIVRIDEKIFRLATVPDGGKTEAARSPGPKAG